jgi:hypothetical protein
VFNRRPRDRQAPMGIHAYQPGWPNLLTGYPEASLVPLIQAKIDEPGPTMRLTLFGGPNRSHRAYHPAIKAAVGCNRRSGKRSLKTTSGPVGLEKTILERGHALRFLDSSHEGFQNHVTLRKETDQRSHSGRSIAHQGP